MRYASRAAIATVALAVAAAVPAAAHAQADLPTEYGIDAGIEFGLGDQSYTSIGLPAQRFRVGFFRNPTFSIEPYGSLQYFKSEGGDGVTFIGVGTGVLYHLSANQAANQVYVRPFVQLEHVTDADTNFGVGAGLGVKVPWRRDFSWRFEAGLGYGFESEAAVLNLGAGLSFFNR